MPHRRKNPSGVRSRQARKPRKAHAKSAISDHFFQLRAKIQLLIQQFSYKIRLLLEIVAIV